ncbi:MAG: GGDEF domain-containing protein [Candidatus Omnitrophica bacterium]|nr:GGDEF domain-containing protein [Candidatus Omnitrophota bacterium]MCM8771421.1 GGDEF domain-containing protein [Candidatus Omnitrophota bacterium]
MLGKSAKLNFMHNSKRNNMLRVSVILILICILSFLFLQNKSNQLRLIASVLLLALAGVFIYRFSLIKGLVAALGFIYLFIFLIFISTLSFHPLSNYLRWVFIIFAVYLGVNLYKYFFYFINGLRLKNQALLDDSTGLFIERYFEVRVKDVFRRALRQPINFTVIIISASTQLKEIAAIIRRSSRKSDFLARHKQGFAILLLGIKERGALIYAEKLRKNIEAALKLKLNFGIVVFPDTPVDTGEKLMHCAEVAVQKATEGSGIYVYRNH